MHSKIVTITPEMALDILTHRNSTGRPLSRERVRRNVVELREGRWRLNPQGIAFAGDDITSELLNGQHRLHAVVQYGRPVDFYAHFDVPLDVVQTMDQGLTRTAAQLVASDDEIRAGARAKPSTLAAAARIVLEYGCGQKKPSAMHVREFVREHAAILDRYAPLAAAYHAGAVGAFAYAEIVGLRGVGEAAHRLRELSWRGAQDPMRALARALPTIKGQGAKAQKTAFWTSVRALEHVDKGMAMPTARKVEGPGKHASNAMLA